MISPEADEAERIKERYARRAALPADRYSRFHPAALHAHQEFERALVAVFKRAGWRSLRGKRVLEIGCGGGANLVELMRLGCAPENLAGCELLPERLAGARRNLPAGVRLFGGDACALDLGQERFDIVMQATVFSSILDDGVQENLARRMWEWVAPGGAVLWYDFTWNNPRNPDVRGVPARRVRALFPSGTLSARRVTLAPPLARAVTRVHPGLYHLFNLLPPLRAHLLCWIAKQA